MMANSDNIGEPIGLLSNPRAWAAIAVFALAWLATPGAMSILQAALGQVFRPGPMPRGTLTEDALAVYTFSYLLWSITTFCIVATVLGRPLSAFPLGDRGWWRRSVLGLATGLAAMTLVVTAILIRGRRPWRRPAISAIVSDVASRGR